jgi:coenzyme F420-reducing hydrogenase beta subunit
MRSLSVLRKKSGYIKNLKYDIYLFCFTAYTHLGEITILKEHPGLNTLEFVYIESFKSKQIAVS